MNSSLLFLRPKGRRLCTDRNYNYKIVMNVREFEGLGPNTRRLFFASVYLASVYRCAKVVIGPRIPRPIELPKIGSSFALCTCTMHP